MRNVNIPTHADLPTSRQLVRSTLIALAGATAILVAVVLPAEYGIDPTGVGKTLGLTEMGTIKMQLAQEAAADRRAAAATPAAPPQAAAAGAAITAATAGRADEMSVTLAPGEGAEVKLAMNRGAKASYDWSVSGGVVNFDLHGDGGGRSAKYEQGKAVPGARGVLEARFDGNHGWFWRNRGTSDVTVTIRANGDYASMKRAI